MLPSLKTTQYNRFTPVPSGRNSGFESKTFKVLGREDSIQNLTSQFMNIAEEGQAESYHSVLPKIRGNISGLSVSPSDLKLKISSKYGRARRMS